MILLAVGTQFPFDRLVSAVDDWAVRADRSDIVAQVGPSGVTTQKLKCFQFLDLDKFAQLQSEADVFIAHAGMGSILTAMQFAKPIIIMPRDHLKGEHRNGHQMATARRFSNTPGVYVAMTESDLHSCLDQIDELKAAGRTSSTASQSMIAGLTAFIEAEPSARKWWPFGLTQRGRSI